MLIRLKEVMSVLNRTPKALKLVWQSSSIYTLSLSILTLLQSLIPVCQVWIGKLIVDGVVQVVSQSGLQSLGRIAFLIVLEFLLVSIGSLLQSAQRFAQEVLQDRLGNHIHVLILEKSLALDMAFFETPSFYDKFEKVRQEATFRPFYLLNETFNLIQNVLMLLTMFGLLFRFHWLAVCVLLVTSSPSLYIQLKFSQLFYGFIDWRTPEGRKQAYYCQLITGNRDAKEVKLFNTGKHLVEAYLDIFQRVHQEKKRLVGERQRASLLLDLLSTVGFYGVYGVIILRTVQRAISIGDMTMYGQAFLRSQRYFGGILRGIANLYESNLFLSYLFEFLDLQSKVAGPAEPKTVPAPIEKGIEFSNVSFKYPGQEKWVLRNVSLTLHPGETVAIVGKNGAGKTTLVKLLTRLYDVTEGEVLLDGINIRDFDLTDYRQQIGVLFQDYAHYYLPAKENIGFGKVEELGNMPCIVASARKSGAHEFLQKLPKGYDTTLGRWFDQGEELSIGQWQKVALARAFMRDAPILVLDEPTASLDAEAEYEVFKQFTELTSGKIAILISHRFSTVRIADRIIVLDEGEIIEQGSHQELIARNGLYARLFSMQAEQYQ